MNFFVNKPKPFFMYIHKDALKVSSEVQKEIPIPLISQSTRFYADEKQALKDGYTPLNFATTVRTLFTNRVVEVKVKNHVYPFTHCSIMPTNHSGFDLIMYMASISVFNMFNMSSELEALMTETTFQPIGIFNPDPGFMSPIIYTNIFIKDDKEEQFENCLIRNKCKFVDIPEDENYYGKRLSGIMKTLIRLESKEEK